jgi:hypothetical protein
VFLILLKLTHMVTVTFFQKIKKGLAAAMISVAMIAAMCAGPVSCTNPTNGPDKPGPGSGHEHDFSNDWKSDKNGHWHECPTDKVKTDYAAHEAGDWKIDKAATLEAPGSKHKECIECKYIMETAVIPPQTKDPHGPNEHTYGNTWISDGVDGHHKDCTEKDGGKITGPHQYVEIEKAPTDYEAGEKYQQCKDCGYETEKTITPALYKKLSDYATVEDIKFDGLLSAASDQDAVSSWLRYLILNTVADSTQRPGLMQQANDIKNQYTGTSGVDAQFAQTVRDLEDNIAFKFNAQGGGDTLKSSQNSNYNGLINAMCNTFGNTDDAAMFRTRLEAYMAAHYLEARKMEGTNKYGTKVDKNTALAGGSNGRPGAAYDKLEEYNTLINQITRPSGEAYPEKISEALKALTTDLIDTSHAGMGDGYYNLLQQFEDWAQFHAFVDDIHAIGKNPHTSKNSDISKIENKDENLLAQFMIKKRGDALVAAISFW